MFFHFSVLFYKGFIITFGQLYTKQSSVTPSTCVPQLHYVHSKVTSRGTKSILQPLVVDKNRCDIFPHEY